MSVLNFRIQPCAVRNVGNLLVIISNDFSVKMHIKDFKTTSINKIFILVLLLLLNDKNDGGCISCRNKMLVKMLTKRKLKRRKIL